MLAPQIPELEPDRIFEGMEHGGQLQIGAGRRSAQILNAVGLIVRKRVLTWAR